MNAHTKAERTHIYTQLPRLVTKGDGLERAHPTKEGYIEDISILLSLLITWKILFFNIFSLRFIFHKNSHRSLLLLISEEFAYRNLWIN